MFSFFNKNIIKGFKVCKNTDRSKKYGIASDTLKVLYEKIEVKLKIKDFQLFYGDALLNEEYFKTVPNQSTIIIVENGETYKTEFDVIFDLFRKTYHETFNARDLIKNFIINHKNENLIKTVIKVQNEMDEKTKISDREKHPEWFSNVDNKKNITKEAIMRTKAKDRIKGYFYKTKDELTKSRIYQELIFLNAFSIVHIL
ncbi:uncharacterized protein Drep4 [Chironomus tepperi]|uniref:uncharacterized protein Drep4 n=1 Tax=Chironomus tepperi TaxID=113505 RepID=UPI00391F78D6